MQLKAKLERIQKKLHPGDQDPIYLSDEILKDETPEQIKERKRLLEIQIKEAEKQGRKVIIFQDEDV
jgi:hypothetical protein